MDNRGGGRNMTGLREEMEHGHGKWGISFAQGSWGPLSCFGLGMHVCVRACVFHICALPCLHDIRALLLHA